MSFVVLESLIGRPQGMQMVCGLPGWFANQSLWMRAREAAFGEMAGDRPLLRDPDYFHGTYSCRTPPSLALIYYEEFGFSDLWIAKERYEKERDRIQRLFPEAVIHRGE